MKNGKSNKPKGKNGEWLAARGDVQQRLFGLGLNGLQVERIGERLAKRQRQMRQAAMMEARAGA